MGIIKQMGCFESDDYIILLVMMMILMSFEAEETAAWLQIARMFFHSNLTNLQFNAMQYCSQCEIERNSMQNRKVISQTLYAKLLRVQKVMQFNAKEYRASPEPGLDAKHKTYTLISKPDFDI